MGNLIDSVLNKKLNRRKFLAASAAGTTSLALSGCGTQLTTAGTNNTATATALNGEETWISAACWHNCGGRCVNKALVVDGVVIRQKTDDTHPDSPEFPQQRGCLRGRSQRKQVFGADRLKYPMKRKHWEPGGGDKSLRGKDEWVRISWDEALDAVAGEIKRIYAEHGPESVIGRGGEVFKVLASKGGHLNIADSNSFGTYCLDATKLGLSTFDLGNANDRFDLKNSETIVLYGCNPAWSSGGNPSWHLMQAKKAGAQFVFVGPHFNYSAAVYDAKWIRVRPGTDTAFLLAVAYTMITEDDPKENPIIDWDFLNRCTVGFDADHMPEDAKINENFMDYVLGKYDGQPKTPQWATEICGTPIEDILWYAREIRKDKKVALLHSFAAARNKNAENFPQIFMAIGAMGGHMGKPGHSTGSVYHAGAANGGPALVTPGNKGLPGVPNPITDFITAPNLWQSVLDGKFNSTGFFTEPKNIKDLDLRMIYWENFARFQTSPNLVGGIEAHRKVDFVVSHAQFFKPEAQYSDIVLPVTTPWENAGGGLLTGNREMLICYSQVVEPLYEAKSDQWIAKELAKRLDINLEEIWPFDEKQQFFNELASCQVIAEDAKTYGPLVTITAADIAEWGVKGEPQQGKISLKEFIDKGVYQVERSEGDQYGFIGYEDFVKDPENNPLSSPNGKFQIYSDWKADTLNGFGYGPAEWKPYPTYTVPVEGYETTFADWGNKVKGDYPYLIFNPHYLRRSHTVFDNIPWLRKTYTNPIYINTSDAAEKGIKDGDTVLIWNDHGKILRHASLTESLMPGCIALPHGAWMDMDEEKGIDPAGADNVLCGPVSSGMAVSGYNNYNCNFEKYQGDPLIPDWETPLRTVNLD
ncbi:molybdopterin-dependent oxidoreductase [Bacillus sp. B15-48]|uniref:molybdopterin-dependent oxidoreductase n=1 Tax=Bacillus sp. B15-48 TaxID=1548601 RepID=UPI00193EF04E|nr:molybdopterin-dependent oxidoreductase [Bacillus sp. B15-48]MBM4765284.1 molybdopterin-dependent oxidoreductase [Bacillus sp. B15-48]